MSCFHIKLVLLAGLLLSACQPAAVVSNPAPQIEIWQVQVSTAAAWLGPTFQACAARLGDVNLVVDVRPAAQLDSSAADFAFQWGARADAPPFAAVISQDSIAVVVHPANPLTKLTLSDVEGLFSGKLDSWSEVIRARCASCGPDFEGKVQAYGYAPGSEMQQATAWLSFGPQTILAPNPAAVRATVAAERYALGVLPARWVDASVRQITIEGAAPGLLQRPLLAMASEEPQGNQRAWLLCLQDGLR